MRPPTISSENSHAGARLERLEDHLDLGVLAGTARLLLVGVDALDSGAEGLAEADAGLAHVGFHAELGAHAVDGDFQVQLAHALQDGLAGLVVHFESQGRVGLDHLVEAVDILSTSARVLGSTETLITGSGKRMRSSRAG